MGEKLVVGPINKGLKTDREPFVIDNDSFPYLANAYQWRGRVKRKRGTELLGRLMRYFNSSSTSYSSSSTIILAGGTGAGNLLTGFSLETNGNIVPGSVTITVGINVYTDVNQDGTLSPSGEINYSTGAIAIVAEAGNNASAVFRYYTDLPVMGLEDLILLVNQFPGTLAFDTTYSYNISTSFPYSIYDVSFYKNVATATYTGYTQKTNWTRTTWNGQDYQQFWTVNYQGALWATNGINQPFTISNIGMQYKPIVTVTVVSGGPPATATLQIIGHNLVVGDFVFINEVSTTTGINLQTGYVITVVDVDNVTVEFPNATLATNGSGGIAQYLTNRADASIDGLRWYDGDPTNGSATSPAFLTGKGWVNFAPPLSNADFSIADLPADQYYLVGAKMILPYKDRLLFFGPVVQTSSAGSQVYLQDTVIYSQNGTPYYTASFTGSAISSSVTFNPILVPTNQTASPAAYFEDVTGFGGFIEAGVDQPINTVSPNEDALIVGFSSLQTRLVYTGNDIVPFNFFLVNSELGSGSTFSIINMDQGVVTRGSRGFIITSQVESRRIDIEIPDEVFQISLNNNGSERFCAHRDFINEWIYFTYPGTYTDKKFPNQTLLYNYRDNSFASFFESYTTYGTFRKQSGLTWASLTEFTWSEWNTPWNSGSSTLKKPLVICGNQQGFVLIRDDDTDEDASLYIRSFSLSTVTSSNHTLNNGDFIIINDCIGSISSEVNGRIFQVSNSSTNTFDLVPAISSGTYSGGGTITRLYVPFIQTKQFPVSWGMARKTRIGPQQYLLTRTPNGQIQLLIYLSQNGSSAYNEGPIVPAVSLNNSLIYSTILYTCPESTNLGLTPANINLNMVTGGQQNQIWHRINTSLIGDTIQLGFTISDDQMKTFSETGESAEITGATQANPCVITCDNNFSIGQMVLIEDVEGMDELNGNIYQIIDRSASDITIDVDATGFTAYDSGGSANIVEPAFATSEVELHGFILDVQSSQVIA